MISHDLGLEKDVMRLENTEWDVPLCDSYAPGVFIYKVIQSSQIGSPCKGMKHKPFKKNFLTPEHLLGALINHHYGTPLPDIGRCCQPCMVEGMLVIEQTWTRRTVYPRLTVAIVLQEDMTGHSAKE